MNFIVRDGKFDVVIAAGPRVASWPSVGVRTLSVLCAEMGLTVGQFGGEALKVKGVIPLPGTGGIVLVEDHQKRIHRIHARAVVRVHAEASLPDPFPGWRSQGMISLSTAEKLRRESQILWGPTTVILGTGNRALRFANQLLESEIIQVFCVEIYPQWGSKRFAAWEVERRRFEVLGGKILEAQPLQLLAKGPLLWQLRLQDSQGIRILDVGRIVSAGPFRDLPGVREYPPSSFLFEMQQTAADTYEEDAEGWALEEQRGYWLAGKIVKSLVAELGSPKDKLDLIFRRARSRLKRYKLHREAPFTPLYQGKWMGVLDAKKMRSFGGIPKQAHKHQLIASIECFEEISCNLCQTVCPTSAIDVSHKARSKNSILKEVDCTACGRCVVACPASAIPLIQESENRPTAQIVLPWRGTKPWHVGEFAVLVNRRGETLGTARVFKILELEPPLSQNRPTQLVQVDVPTHLIWEARGIKRGRTTGAIDEAYLAAVTRSAETVTKVEVLLDGEKRLVRDRVPISLALFEMGKGRPEDMLYCKDGTCGLCLISVDSVKKLACTTRIHKRMNIRTTSSPPTEGHPLCPCLGITQEMVTQRIRQGKLDSPEAVLSVTHVGEGKCHGQLCMGAFRRILIDQGIQATHWIDWRFPWSDWILTHDGNA